MTTNTPAGWYHDPTGQGDGRYWNGVSWTEAVDRAGTTYNVPIDPSLAQVPPTPGTQIAQPMPQAVPQTVNVSSSKSSPWGAIIGGLVAVIAIIALIVALTNSSSDDTPTPGTDAPAEPAPEEPAEGG